MRIGLFILLLTGLGGPGLAAGKDARPSLCESQETAVFACKSGGRIISLCASQGMNRHGGYLQYRSGVPGKLDLEYPASKSVFPRNAFVRGNSNIGGGGTDFLRFQIGADTYFLYSWMAGDHAVKDGVFIERDGKRVAALICQSEALNPDDNWRVIYDAKLPEVELLFQPW